MPKSKNESLGTRHVRHSNVAWRWLFGYTEHMATHAVTWLGLCTQARDRAQGDEVLRAVCCDLSAHSQCQKGQHMVGRKDTRESRQWIWKVASWEIQLEPQKPRYWITRAGTEEAYDPGRTSWQGCVVPSWCSTHNSSPGMGGKASCNSMPGTKALLLSKLKQGMGCRDGARRAFKLQS